MAAATGEPAGSPDPPSESSIGRALRALLEESHLLQADDLPALARRHVRSFGGTGVSFYLADLQQTVLVPFPGRNGAGSGEQFEPLLIDSTLAGRAYQHLQILSRVRGPGDAVVWLPLLDGTERLGVLAVTAAAHEQSEVDALTGGLQAFATLLAELVMSKTQYGDTVVRLRRQAEMGLAAELQWSLLPPLTFACAEVTVAAALEPAYEVAGDTVDYAVDAHTARLAIFDGMGHGLRSAQLAAMSVAAYRHSRRAGRSLAETCLEMDRTLTESFAGTTFTTAVLVELDVAAGVLSWVNAGHPEPLLLRDGRLVKRLGGRPRPPLGVDLTGTGVSPVPVVEREPLQPNDIVLLYTDGVIEARSPDGEFFGEQRLVDLVFRNLAAGLPAPETMRRVVRTLLEHQQGRLTDDATLALLSWRGSADRPAP